uniref:Triokinase/FMN cyclase n=1 Tax=Scleropages formosus TaxID=113540 RepID=A0A8C9R8U4_SCLFO
MTRKEKLLNSPQSCVDEALRGVVAANAGLALLRGHRVALRSDLRALKGRVALLSGGGSGHEPAHAGYVGAGMLSAAVAGAVFASPPPGSVLAAILTLWQAGVSGVLLIIKNYTGDRLNFGLALEQARAQGVPVAMVIVADDCAFAQPSKAGRRGLCGTVLVHKLAGALAEEGHPLDEIVTRVTKAVKGIGTLGVSLSPCSVPGCLPTFELPPGDMELGLGIHGEPGIKRLKVGSADEVVKMMIDHMTDSSSQSHLPLKSGDTVVLCVNNLGALSCLEMAVVTRAAFNCLEGRGLKIARVMSGSFMTSLEMTGMSLTVMRVDQEILRLLDAKTTAPGWPNLSSVDLSGRNCIMEPAKRASDKFSLAGSLSAVIRRALEKVCVSLLSAQEELNALDRASGDGDCGSTHALAVHAIQEWLSSHVVPGCPGQLLSTLAGLLQERMGGSSGALYSLFLTAAAPLLRECSDPAAWASAVLAGTEWQEVLLDGAWKAELGAQSTCELTARAGRASYIASKRVTLPDPGAVAVATIFRAVFVALAGSK